ncbi:MAG: hypothetical protein MJE77_14380 [Proteobacteria bacterium]|nr:hypothetical protein [Pseudomonadota bacterium]
MRSAIIVFSAAYTLCGCAFLTMQAPATNDPSQRPRCSEGRRAVAIDVVVAGLYSLVGLAALYDDESAGAVPLLLGGLHLGSALSGHNAANRCAKAHDAYARWLKNQLAPADSTGQRTGPPDAPGRTVDPGVTDSSQPGPDATPPSARADNRRARSPQNAQSQVAPSQTAPSAGNPLRMRKPVPLGQSVPLAEPTDDKAELPAEQPAARPSRAVPKQSARRDSPRDNDPWADFWQEETP